MENETGHATESLRRSTLDNGLRVLTTEVPHARSVCVCVFVGVGSRYEPEQLAGASHLVEHLVFKGTSRRPTPADISLAVEGVGGVLNASTEHELTVYWCKMASRYLENGLDVLIDMLLNSVFDPTELDRERRVVLEEQSMVNDHPSNRVDALLDEMLWPDHPLGREISGTRESVSAITRPALLDYFGRFYTPSNTVVSIAGPVGHENIVARVEALTRDWSGGPAPTWVPFHDGQAAPRSRLEFRKTEQAHVAIGLPALSQTHPDRYALDVLSVVLGEGMSSRLFQEVREKRGFAYDVGSGITYFLDCGALVINAGVDPKQTYGAVETILHEVERLREGVPDDELGKAKRLIAGRLLLMLEDTRAVAGWAGSQEMLLGEVLTVDEVLGHVEAVGRGDLRRVADSLLLGGKLNVGVVGPVRGVKRLERAMAALPDATPAETAQR